MKTKRKNSVLRLHWPIRACNYVFSEKQEPLEMGYAPPSATLSEADLSSTIIKYEKLQTAITPKKKSFLSTPLLLTHRHLFTHELSICIS